MGCALAGDRCNWSGSGAGELSERLEARPPEPPVRGGFVPGVGRCEARSFTVETQRTRRKRRKAGGTAIPVWVFDTPHFGERRTGRSACATGATSYVAQALLPVRFFIIAGIAPQGTLVTAVARMFSRRARLKLFTLPERDQARRVPKVKFPLVLTAASLVLVSGAPALARPGATSSTTGSEW